MKRFAFFCVALVAALSVAPAARGGALNPQEIGLVVDNFLVDVDANVIGMLDEAGGGSHGATTFVNRSVYAGQPDNALVTEPLANW
jgi:hypothetical protein